MALIKLSNFVIYKLMLAYYRKYRRKNSDNFCNTQDANEDILFYG